MYPTANDKPGGIYLYASEKWVPSLNKRSEAEWTGMEISQLSNQNDKKIKKEFPLKYKTLLPEALQTAKHRFKVLATQLRGYTTEWEARRINRMSTTEPYSSQSNLTLKEESETVSVPRTHFSFPREMYPLGSTHIYQDPFALYVPKCQHMFEAGKVNENRVNLNQSITVLWPMTSWEQWTRSHGLNLIWLQHKYNMTEGLHWAWSDKMWSSLNDHWGLASKLKQSSLTPNLKCSALNILVWYKQPIEKFPIRDNCNKVNFYVSRQLKLY